LVTWVGNIISIPIFTIMGAVGVIAVAFFMNGFDRMNDFFWKQYKEKESV
jgi:hypothetical protein